MWITTNCGKFFRRWEYQTTLPVSWEICMQVKKQQLKLDKEHKSGSKSGKEYSRLYILPCLFNLYAGYSIKNAGTPVFIATLFIIARTWKQPRCPSADEWIRKLWYIYTMEYYSAIKKNTFESVLMRWMRLEPIIQSEISQKEKHQYSIITHIYGI